MTVRFVKTYGMFETGRTYVLPDRTAELMISQRLAEAVTPPAAATIPNKSIKPGQVLRGGM